MERFNQTIQDTLARVVDPSDWSLSLDDAVMAYNKTVHSTIKYSPAVALYSQLCKDLREVPAGYRQHVASALRKFDSFDSLKLVVKDEVTVRFYLWTVMLGELSKRNLLAAAEKSKKQSIRRHEPTDIAVGSICYLLSPGDPKEKRNFLKPRHKNDDDSTNRFLRLHSTFLRAISQDGSISVSS